jgi:hypothetical protein
MSNTLTGNVNFDAGLIRENAQNEMAAIDAVQLHAPNLGGNRVLGSAEASAEDRPMSNVNKIGVALMLTLNTGFDLIRGLKDLRTVKIGDASEVFNFYNPFVRGNPEKGQGDGLLRRTLSTIARQANAVLGNNVVFLGTDSDAASAVSEMSKSLVRALEKRFPLPADNYLLEVPVVVDGVETTRPVSFGELFAVRSWTTVDLDEETGINTHFVTINIVMNAGALYDTAEPQAFVRRARTFLENTLKTADLSHLQHNVALAFDSQTLVQERTRDMLDILVAEDEYFVVSRASVVRGEHSIIDAGDVDKLFGYGSDVLLLSPFDEASEADAQEEAPK